MKKVISALALSALLIGCSDEGVKEADTTEKVEEQAEVKQEVRKTPEEYIADFKESTVFQELQQSAGEDMLYFNEAVDFNGDEVPEMVVGLGYTVAETEVFVYKYEDSGWDEIANLPYDSGIAMYFEPIGTITYDDSPKEAFAFNKAEAGANTMGYSITILDYTDMIKEIELETVGSVSWDLEQNKFSLRSGAEVTDYIFKNGKLVDNEGKAITLLDEELAELLGTTINDYFISKNDAYYVAQEKITEELKSEEYYLGANCSFYSTFYICDSALPYLLSVALPSKDVTAEQLSKFFNQTIEIEDYSNVPGDGMFSDYPSWITTEEGTYQLLFDGDSPQSLLVSLQFTPTEYAHDHK